ncbi:flagellar hook-associated protein 3 [Geobacter sp. OR-1]|uniref:flagellin N-terminal helical domain-containing protein n=1 Tax=Geobacter sp. OR-1 TaxID=1266765 RepID=UPI000543B4BB|nr:hypothetical protein [Geobacter sp. OR-1]GAM09668.1 flagellar hook-associated protein 3 [Geobacter sp. OR-1]
MRITQNMSADNALYNIQKGRAKLDRLQAQIASELNYLSPSDDPISTRYILDLENKIKESTQYVKNIQNANIWVSVTDQTLTAMSGVLTQAKSTVSNILGGSNDPSLTKMAIGQLTELKKQLIDLGNTQVGDDYIFGGFKNKYPPFRNDVWTLQGDTAVGATAVANVDTTSLMVGMPVTGTGIPPNTTITAINGPNSLTLSQAAVAGAGVGTFMTFGMDTQVTGDTLTGSTTIKNVYNASNLSVGMKISGAGIPQDTTITAISADSGTITISNAATATAADTVFSYAIPNSISGKTNANNATVRNIFDTSGLQPGMSVSGPGIPENTSILSVDSKNQITLSNVSLQTIDGVMLTFGNNGTIAGTVTGNTTSGSTTIANVPTANLALGMPIDGASLQDGTVIGAIAPAVGPVTGDVIAGTSTIGNIDTTGLVVGMPFSGTGIPPGAVVTDIVGAGPGSTITFDTIPSGGTATATATVNDLQFQSLVTISKPATGSAVGANLSIPLSGDITNGSVTVSNLFDTSTMANGMTITGPGIPSGTTITIVDAHTVTLSQPATASATGSPLTVKFSGNTVAGSATVSFGNIFDMSSLSLGMPITGAGIPADTTITAIDPLTHQITLSNAATATGTEVLLDRAIAGNTQAQSKVLTGLFSTASLLVGMPVRGTGIPDNTVITSINSPTSISISNASTATANGVSLSFDRDYTGFFGTDDQLNVDIDRGVVFWHEPVRRETAARGVAEPGSATNPGRHRYNQDIGQPDHRNSQQ